MIVNVYYLFNNFVYNKYIEKHTIFYSQNTLTADTLLIRCFTVVTFHVFWHCFVQFLHRDICQSNPSLTSRKLGLSVINRRLYDTVNDLFSLKYWPRM